MSRRPIPHRLLCLGLITLAGGTPGEAAETARNALFAERITLSNAATRRVEGPDATAGIDDWALGNGVICAAVTDPAHESDLSDRGAVLVDLGHCGRADDQWTTLQPILNLSQSTVVPVSEIEPSVTDDEARIRTRGVLDGVEVETLYAVRREPETALHITTRITRLEEGGRFFSYGAVVLHPDAALRPFHARRADPRDSRGFQHPGGDPSSILSMLGAIVPADLLVWLGSREMGPPIAYGLELILAERTDADGRIRPVPGFSITGPSYTMAGTLARPPWLGSSEVLGALGLAQVPFMDLGIGDSLHLERRLWVGRNDDVASVTDALFADAPGLRARVEDPATAVHIDDPRGRPISMVRPDPQGRIAARLPPGRYQLRIHAPGAPETRVEVDHPSPSGELALPRIPTARVVLPRGQPMRLVFRGETGTPDPIFRSDGLDLRIGGETGPSSLESGDVVLVGGPGDPTDVALAPGRYRVYAVRGPEHSVTEAVLEVPTSGRVTLEIAAPARLFDLPDWVSADLHVHTGASFDSALPPTWQIGAFHAAAVDLIVATEHDRVVDPQPAIDALGLSDALIGVTGVEITSEFKGGAAPFSNGHSNAFPVRARPLRNRGGAPQAEGRRLRDVWAELRAAGTPILQLNHPRSSPDPADNQSYLSHLAVEGRPFDPALPLTAPVHRHFVEVGPDGLRDLDFDAMELLNGSNQPAYLRGRADWFSLLLQGERRTGTANSDSHRLGEPAGLPRNYVQVPAPGQARQTRTLLEQVRRGALFGTTGPLLQVRLDEARLGDLHAGADATLHVVVRAAPWVPVSELRVYVNGTLAEARAIEAPASLQLPLHFPADGFVTVEVEGEADDRYAAVAPGFAPFAFTNPIFVDADGDGTWRAPGLPSAALP